MDDIGFRKIAIVGMGLIGGSLALALKRSVPGFLLGIDSDPNSLNNSRLLQTVDQTSTKLEAVAGADLVILATPMNQYERILAGIAPYLDESALVTDVGSVKQPVVTLAETILKGRVSFVGGHPMAGSEKGGFAAASVSLFENAYYFLTPGATPVPACVKRLERLIRQIGAYPVVKSAAEHDRIVAQISHLPHLAAVLLANMLDIDNGLSHLPFVGGGFRDSTRIASGNPRMWQDIFERNKDPLLDGIRVFKSMLSQFEEDLRGGRTDRVLSSLQRAKEIRDSIPHGTPDYIPPLYELIVDVEDRPNILGQLTRLIGRSNINIKDIEIMHMRQDQPGAVRLGFETFAEQEKAFSILRNGGFLRTFRKGDVADVNGS